MYNTNLQFEIREVASWASESGEAYPNMSDGEVLDEVIQRLEILANLKAKSEVPNLRAFKVTFLSPTKHRGARVKIVDILTKSRKDVSDAWAKMRHTIVLPYDYGIGSIQEQAIEHMACIPRLSVVAQTQVGDDEYIILSDSWSDGPHRRYVDLDGVALDEHEEK